MADKFGGADNIVSAGFVQIYEAEYNKIEAHVYGGSTTLQKKALDEDSRFIERALKRD